MGFWVYRISRPPASRQSRFVALTSREDGHSLGWEGSRYRGKGYLLDSLSLLTDSKEFVTLYLAGR